MNDVAVRARDLGKRYYIGQRLSRPEGLGPRVRYALEGAGRFVARNLRRFPGDEIFWALRGVSFDVPQGEVLGIIGRNGAGKSTLLKILARITEPSEGSAEIRGRVGALLEIGMGFHPELTGRENIFLNGAILGMYRAEIRRRFGEIVEFAELERFIDTPVKRYSSGMRVRLGFAVAAYLDPELLLIDEVLAVGDAAFQKRCLGRMNDVARSGRTVLFVSHNMGAVANLTSRCLYLDHGRVLMHAETHEVLDRYLGDSLARSGGSREGLDHYRRENNPDAIARFEALRIEGEGGQPDGSVPDLEIGEEIRIAMTVQAGASVRGANVALTVKRPHGEPIATLLSWDSGYAVDLPPGRSRIVCTIRDLALPPGLYFIDVGINQSTGTLAWDVILDYPAFRVINRGPHMLRHRPDRPGLVVCRDVDWRLDNGGR